MELTGTKKVVCEVSYHASDLHDAAMIAYWRHDDGGVHYTYHAQKAVEAFDTIAPLIETLRASLGSSPFAKIEAAPAPEAIAADEAVANA